MAREAQAEVARPLRRIALRRYRFRSHIPKSLSVSTAFVAAGRKARRRNALRLGRLAAAQRDRRCRHGRDRHHQDRCGRASHGQVLAEDDGTEQHGDDRLADQHDRHRRLQRAGVKRRLLQDGQRDSQRDKHVGGGNGQQRVPPADGVAMRADLGEHGDHAEQDGHRDRQQHGAGAADGAAGGEYAYGHQRHGDHEHQRPGRDGRHVVALVGPANDHEPRQRGRQQRGPAPLGPGDALAAGPRAQREREQQRRHQQRLHQHQRTVGQRQRLERVAGDGGQGPRPPQRFAERGRRHRRGHRLVGGDGLGHPLPDDDAHRGPEGGQQRRGDRDRVLREPAHVRPHTRRSRRAKRGDGSSTEGSAPAGSADGARGSSVGGP